MNVTARIRSIERNGNPQKLFELLHQCNAQNIDITAWQKRLKPLLQKYAPKPLNNHEIYKVQGVSEYGLTSPRPDAIWSGTNPIPQRGDRVYVATNGIGNGIVRGYFVEHGYLGIYVEPDFPPLYFIVQNWENPVKCVMVFGLELRTPAS